VRASALARPLLALGLLAAGASPALAKSPWRLTIDADGPYLTVGDAESESPATSLHCKPHEGKIGVTLFVERRVADRLKGDTWVDKAGRPYPWPTTVRVVSGPVSADVAAKTSPDEMNGGSEVDLTLAPTAPVMVAFAKSGALKFTAWGETTRDPPVPPALAAKLVKGCSR